MADLTLVELIDIITRYIGELELQFMQVVEKAGLTVKQMEYIDVIHSLKHPTLGEIAEKLELSKPSVTSIVDKLATLGFLERVKSDEDRRSAHVHLTAGGNELVRMHDDVHKNIARFFENTLNSSDLKNLTVILNRSIKNLPK